MTHEERLTNTCILLNDSSSTVPLPKNTYALKVLQATVEPVAAVIDESLLAVNQICVTLWMEDNGRKTWYVGYCKEVLDKETFVVEHLERVKRGSSLKWRYPVMEDVHQG